MRFKDLTGKKFNRLTVIKRSKSTKRANGKTRTNWLCLCDCGKHIIVESSNLVYGNSRSCGCLKHENIKEIGKKNITHGMTNTRIYRIWGKIKDRCLNKKCRDYPYYGGRGITIFTEWEKSFQSFYNWSIKNGYKDNLTIDRIDVNGNYEPSNCRWATWIQQENNKRTTIFVEYKGKKQSISDWCRELNLNYNTVKSRLLFRKWTPEKALTKTFNKSK